MHLPHAVSSVNFDAARTRDRIGRIEEACRRGPMPLTDRQIVRTMLWDMLGTAPVGALPGELAAALRVLSGYRQLPDDDGFVPVDHGWAGSMLELWDTAVAVTSFDE